MRRDHGGRGGYHHQNRGYPQSSGRAEEDTAQDAGRRPNSIYLNRLQQRLEAHGGRYFAADRLSVADLKVSEMIRNLRSGALDHIPTDLPERVAPKLVEHYERIMSDPRVKAYYANLGNPAW